jgi:O-antigen ligase
MRESSLEITKENSAFMNINIESSSAIIKFINIYMLFWGALIFIYDGFYNALPLVLFFISLYLIIKYKAIELDNKYLKYLYITFFIYTIPIVISIMMDNSSMSYLDRPARFLLFIPIGFLLASYSFNKENLLYGFLIGATIVMTILVWKWFHGDHRPQYWAHSNILSEVTVGVFCFGFVFYNKQYNRLIKAIALICQLVTIIIVFASGSRGSLLSILVVIFSYAAINFFFLNKKKGVLIFVFSLIFMAAFLLVFQDSMQDRIVDGFQNAKNYLNGDTRTGTSVGYRFELWKASKLIFMENPMLGSGNIGSANKLKDLITEGKIEPYLADRQHHHSDYIEALVTRGLLGLLTVLMIYFVPLYLFWKKIKSQTALALPAFLFIISYMVCSFAEVPLRNGFSLVFYFMMTTIFVSQVYSNPLKKHAPS